MKPVRGECPKCGGRNPPTLIRVQGPALVTLNVRCEFCWKRGVLTTYDIKVQQDAA